MKGVVVCWRRRETIGISIVIGMVAIRFGYCYFGSGDGTEERSTVRKGTVKDVNPLISVRALAKDIILTKMRSVGERRVRMVRIKYF